MTSYEYNVNRFKQRLNHIESHPEIRQRVLESEKSIDDFYNLCSDFSHISIHAQKSINEDMTMSCYPNKVDVDDAVDNTMQFVEQYEITDTNALLEIIRELHPYAIKEDDIKNRVGYVKNNHRNSMLYGMRFDFSRLPDGTWYAIKDILLGVENSNNPLHDDIATLDDIKAIEEGMKEFAEGKATSHEDIDWE